MVLYGLLVSSGCRRCLHGERYDFEDQVSTSSREVIQRPRQYFLLGFRDRNLEDEYLNDLSTVSRNPILLGYCICIVLVGCGIFSYDVAGINTTTVDVVQNPDSKRDYGHSTLDTFQAMLDVVLAFAILLAGFVSSVLIFRWQKCRNKSVVIHIAEGVYLSFIILTGWDFSKLSTGKGELAFPIGGWVFNLAFFYLAPSCTITGHQPALDTDLRGDRGSIVVARHFGIFLPMQCQSGIILRKICLAQGRV